MEICSIAENSNALRSLGGGGAFPLLKVMGTEYDLAIISSLPYFGKRKQVTKVTFLVKEQNVSVISTDVNGISCLT